MLAIIIFKWLFIISTIVLSIYHYVIEREKLNTISKYIKDQKILSDLKAAARSRMGMFLLLFTAMVVWIMSYDIEIEDISRQKDQLTHELENASRVYADMNVGEQRLTQAKVADDNLINETKSYYSDIFVNYYVMRKCNMAQADDVFIINSAMTREIGLNRIPLPLSFRNDIIMDAKTAYIKKFASFECSQLQNKNNDIVNNYRNYIQTVREVLKATF